MRWTVHGERSIYESDWVSLRMVDVEIPGGRRFDHHVVHLPRPASGTVVVDASDLRLDELEGYVERTFRHVAESKTVDFMIRFDPRLPRTMLTDAKRLQQIIKNLLSNAFKFTEKGKVTLRVGFARSQGCRSGCLIL